MDKKESYRKDIVAKVEAEAAKLVELKAKMCNTATGVRTKDTDRIEFLEQKISEGKSSLRELNRAQANTRGRTNDKMGRSWRKLQDSLQDDISTFEGEH